MNKQPNLNPTKAIPLDDYEKELAEFLDKGIYHEAGAEDLKSTKKMFQQAVKFYNSLQKSKRITLRVNNQDLIKVKAKAIKNQIPYQRLISALIHKYAEGEMKLAL